METNIARISYFTPREETPTRAASGKRFGHSAQESVQVKEIDLEKIAVAVRSILEAIGEDPDREGLIDTPSRVARMYQELVYGNQIDPAAEITCTFHEDTDEMVLVREIPFTSMCEHHMLPFIGTAGIAYVPEGGKITGLSKLARVVELAARKLQVQERLTSEIAEAVSEKLGCAGVLVFLEAEHMCMSMRGIKKSGSTTITTAARGIFKQDQNLRCEAMKLLSGR